MKKNSWKLNIVFFVFRNGTIQNTLHLLSQVIPWITAGIWEELMMPFLTVEILLGLRLDNLSKDLDIPMMFIRKVTIHCLKLWFWRKLDLILLLSRSNMIPIWMCWKNLYWLVHLDLATELDLRYGISYILYWNFDEKSCFVVFVQEWNEWKNPHFNFSSQNLSIERNFFKWDGKISKI